MATTIFAVEIELSDHGSQVTPDSNLGLFNRNSDFASNASAGATTITVDDGSIFKPGNKITISDTAPNSEIGSILSIAGNVLTLSAALINSYTTANSAKVVGNSVFRWIQSPVVGLTGYTSGIIIENGIGKWKRSIELEGGGNIAEPGGASVAVKNGNKFYDILDTKGIVINGSIFRVQEFSDTTLTQKWTGFCQKPNWDEFSYRIPAQGGHNKRRANLTTIITDEGFPNSEGSVIGKTVPLSFGKLTKAKFIRVGNKDKTLSNTFEDSAIIGGTPRGVVVFKIDVVISSTQYQIKVSSASISDTTAATNAIWAGAYLFVVEGGSTEKGKFRRIKSVDSINVSNATVEVTIEKNFENDLTSSGPETWVSVRAIEQDYQSDIWPGKDFLDNAGSVITASPEIFSFDSAEEVFSALPTMGIKISGSNKNLLDIEADFFEKNPDTLSGFTVIKPKSISLLKETDLTLFNNAEESGQSIIKESDGIYKTEGDVSSSNVKEHFISAIKTFESPNTIDKIIDKTQATFGRISLTQFTNIGSNAGIVSAIAVALDVEMPEIPAGLGDFDDVGFLVRHSHSGVFDDAEIGGEVGGGFTRDANVLVYTRRFVGNAKNEQNITGLALLATSLLALNATSGQKNVTVVDGSIFKIGDSVTISDTAPGSEINSINSIASNVLTMTNNLANTYTTAATAKVDLNIDNTLIHTSETFPDKYWIVDPLTKDKFFFSQVDTTILIQGHKSFFMTNISDEGLYNAIVRATLMIKPNVNNNGNIGTIRIDHTWDIFEIAIIFIKSISIKNQIFSGLSGRIFDDTWNSRKTAADLISNPVDLFEHVCRLQNWEENSIMPTDGWGKNYGSNALIKTAGDGSFDATDPEFLAVKNYSMARQVFNHQGGFTDRLKRSICKNYFLANWIDADGNECLKRIIKTNATGLDTVTLNDIDASGSIRVIDPDPSRIFPELFVRFEFDTGLDDFTKAIRISNVDFVNPTGAQKQGFIDGITGSSAETIWDKANALWLKTRRLNKPSSDMTDLLWSNGANSDVQAFDQIVNWLDLQSNVKVRITGLHYNKVKLWEETRRFELTLVHHTNSITIECLVTTIDYDPNPPFLSEVEVIMFKTPLPAAFSLVDVLDPIGGDSDLIDQLDAIGGDSDKVDKL